MSLIQLLAICGALMILAAYGANQLRLMGPERRSYSFLNFVGSGVLATIALMEEQWGFLLLEGVWALVSAVALLRPRTLRAAPD